MPINWEYPCSRKYLGCRSRRWLIHYVLLSCSRSSRMWHSILKYIDNVLVVILMTLFFSRRMSRSWSSRLTILSFILSKTKLGDWLSICLSSFSRMKRMKIWISNIKTRSSLYPLLLSLELYVFNFTFYLCIYIYFCWHLIADLTLVCIELHQYRGK